MATRIFADLLDAYVREYLPLKATTTQYQEGRVYLWLREELGHVSLDHMTPLMLRTWRDSLSPHYKPNSIRRYMTALSAVFTVAVRDYGWMEKHPLRSVAKPPAAPDRARVLTQEELHRLLEACKRSRNLCLYPAVVTLIATGARKNEILQRQWRDIDLERGILSVPYSKNGERRAIPLIRYVWDLLKVQAQRSTSVWVFARQDGLRPTYIDYAWWTACDRAKIPDLHIHDLRHCCASWLAMSGATIQEIATILGHRSLSQTLKYSHLLEPHTRGVLETMAQEFIGGSMLLPPQPPPVPPARSVLETAEEILAAAQAPQPPQPPRRRRRP
jgi:integrase